MDGAVVGFEGVGELGGVAVGVGEEAVGVGIVRVEVAGLFEEGEGLVGVALAQEILGLFGEGGPLGVVEDVDGHGARNAK